MSLIKGKDIQFDETLWKYNNDENNRGYYQKKLLTPSSQRQQRGNFNFFLNLNVNYPKPIDGETPS